MCRQRQKLGGSSRSTEAALFGQAQAGCRADLNRLMGMHDGLVQAAVRRQVLGDLPYAEAIQAGRTGLWRAIMRFDPDRGCAFSTYAWMSIVHHVWRAVKVHTRVAQTVPSEVGVAWCADGWSMAGVDPVVLVTGRCIDQALYELVMQLPERLRYVIVARYGLGGQPARLYREIGQHLGLSRERVRQLHAEALVWLRQPAISHALRTLSARHRVADYVWAESEAQDWLRRRGGRHGRP